MPNPLRDLLFGQAQQPKRELVEAITPRRSFDDVILPESTRTALHYALNQIRKRELIFGRWGLGERHATGMGLAFNFAGPPGTGKTICAEAIAFALGKRLLLVRYSEMESLWAGETGKNVAAVFHSAREQDAVLFFDEADAIAGRRFANVTQGYQREANTVVNVLLKELEEFDGVIIFATNLAANFDPAFERRVRTHILFEMPGAEERTKIWKVQLHEAKTPLADDVDFNELGEKYALSGGDIKNAVLKAAQIAASEPGADAEKKIHQKHFIQGVEDVTASKKVMEQSIYDTSGLGDGSHRSSESGANGAGGNGVPAGFNPMQAISGLNGAWQQVAEDQQEASVQIEEMARRIGDVEMRANALPGIVERFDDAARERELKREAEARKELEARLQALADELKASGSAASDEKLAALARELEAQRARELDERLQVLAAELSEAREDQSRELESRLQVLAGDIEAHTARVGQETEALREQIEGSLAQRLAETDAKLDQIGARLQDELSSQLKAERESRALALREQNESGAAMLAQAREEWPRQLAAHSEAQNMVLRETVEKGLKQSVEPLRSELQVLAGQARSAAYSSYAAIVLAIVAAVLAFVVK